MPTRSSKTIPKDVNQNAARIVAMTTGQPVPENVLPNQNLSDKELRSRAASILGKLGGSKGGKMRAANLSSARRSEIASKAAQMRWTKAQD
ncbi:MAG: hypothetical protein LV481_06230 [Methylacidiphilales bacterium]|nr:hypothetical protein [Candidatus Methylacidiphilales bacterium]